jgi:Beta-ketoacyl synthase, C-terminal domain
MKTWIWNYECQTAAGPSVSRLWTSLSEGLSHLVPVPTETWPMPARFLPHACLWNSPTQTSREKLGNSIASVFAAARESIREQVKDHRQGIIFASTKGATEDYVWGAVENVDPVNLLLEDFLAKHPGEFRDSLSLSHACTSFLIALKWAHEWLLQERVDGVWVISADEVGPFVLNGFNCLKALSPGQTQPFSGNRDGLNLGEGTVAIYVSKFRPHTADAAYFTNIETDTEGFAVTRPSSAGDSLYRVCKKVLSHRPDFVVAHGTGTPINDKIEDQVFQRLFSSDAPPIASTKWSVGHTLGSSAGVDLCAALKVFKHSSLFKIARTEEPDRDFLKSYLTKNSNLPLKAEFQSALITSLGFGGVHAAVQLKVDHAN